MSWVRWMKWIYGETPLPEKLPDKVMMRRTARLPRLIAQLSILALMGTVLVRAHSGIPITAPFWPVVVAGIGTAILLIYAVEVLF